VIYTALVASSFLSPLINGNLHRNLYALQVSTVSLPFSTFPEDEVGAILRVHQDSPVPREECGWKRVTPTPSYSCTSHCERAGKCLLGLLLFLAVFCSLGSGQQELVADVHIHGNRRIPAETIRSRIFTRPGDVYDPAAIERDFNSLWNTGYFEDIRFEREQTTKGWVIHVYVKERPTIRVIDYLGLNSVSKSDVLDRFKERKVGLSPESQYDPTKVKQAEVRIKELHSEQGT